MNQHMELHLSPLFSAVTKQQCQLELEIMSSGQSIYQLATSTTVFDVLIGMVLLFLGFLGSLKVCSTFLSNFQS